MRNCQKSLANWQLLMNQTKSMFASKKNQDFDQAIHLFPTNSLVALHNRKMLQQLNVPIAISATECSQQNALDYANDEQLQVEMLLANGQQVMLTTNIWVLAGLVNGSLGLVKDIVYAMGAKPPQLPEYVVELNNYIGLAWD